MQSSRSFKTANDVVNECKLLKNVVGEQKMPVLKK